jgi:cell wall-associated NlpC family hydrolase
VSVHVKKLKTGAALVGAAAVLALLPAGAAASCTPGAGGISAGTTNCGPVGKAKLRADGQAVAPANAPLAVRDAIAAANRIDSKPYIYGGGHGKWWDKGYDCSGAVSYALHGGGLLDSPLPSTSFMKWDLAGTGRWITVYANGGHAYAVIAGLRWDTSMTPGDGPGWSTQMRSGAGYVARHPTGY